VSVLEAEGLRFERGGRVIFSDVSLAVRPGDRVAVTGLIADEPTAEQDAATRELVLARLLGVASDGGALVLATHDPEVVARCDHVVSLARHLPAAPL
jgi:predicted ABC-type transport system involved in lysophospholipase L1 biosynthesis ATPase subunit